jgi:hypothetical protein
MLATVGLGIETMFTYVDKMKTISTHDVVCATGSIKVK